MDRNGRQTDRRVLIVVVAMALLGGCSSAQSTTQDAGSLDVPGDTASPVDVPGDTASPMDVPGDTAPAMDGTVLDAPEDVPGDVPGDTLVFDVPTDEGCPSGMAACASGCTDLQTDSANCGSCGMACPVPTHSVANCVRGGCGFFCNTGYGNVGEGCLPAPRQVAPLSTATVTSQRPTLHWALPTGSPAATGAEVTLCRDRAMTVNCTIFSGTGNSGAPGSALTPGVWFWSITPMVGTNVGSVASVVWQFTVGARSAAVDTSWGTTHDINGDGYADVLVGNNNGAVYVYPGSATGLATTATVTLSGSNTFGYSMASVGDVNGDGYTDVIVGTGAGAAYVYLGSATGLSATAVITLSGSGLSGFGEGAVKRRRAREEGPLAALDHKDLPRSWTRPGCVPATSCSGSPTARPSARWPVEHPRARLNTSLLPHPHLQLSGWKLPGRKLPHWGPPGAGTCPTGALQISTMVSGATARGGYGRSGRCGLAARD